MEKSLTAFRGKALYDYIEPLEYGTVIQYQEIESVTDTQKNTSAYYNAINKAKKLLTAAGKLIVPVGHGSYRIIYPGDYTSAYAREVRCAKRRLSQGKKILDGAPVKDMSEAEITSYNAVCDFNLKLTAQFNNNVVQVRTLVHSKHPMQVALTDDNSRD